MPSFGFIKGIRNGASILQVDRDLSRLLRGSGLGLVPIRVAVRTETRDRTYRDDRFDAWRDIVAG